MVAKVVINHFIRCVAVARRIIFRLSRLPFDEYDGRVLAQPNDEEP